MPTTLGPAFPPDYRGLPTHMSTEDSRIWTLFQPELQTRATTLYFDVRLGGGQAVADAAGLPFADMWYRLNAKRADVLAVTPEYLELIELRYAAQPNAIGRLLTYELLWQHDPALPGRLRLHLVTDHFDADVLATAARYNIKYTVV